LQCLAGRTSLFALPEIHILLVTQRFMRIGPMGRLGHYKIFGLDFSMRWDHGEKSFFATGKRNHI
jgi:hypothetical protein